MKYAIKYYMTPEEIAEQVKTLCGSIHPCKGYTLDEYDAGRRLDDIARMVEALRDGIDQHEKLQLADVDQFHEVYTILEWDNFHTENIAFSLAFGDAAGVLDALQAAHSMGQSYAIRNKLEYGQLVF